MCKSVYLVVRPKICIEKMCKNVKCGLNKLNQTLLFENKMNKCVCIFSRSYISSNV